MPTLKLAQASDAQRDAAFRVVFPEIIALARLYARQVNMPFMQLEKMAVEKLSTPEAKAQIMKILDDALDAAEAVEHPAGV